MINQILTKKLKKIVIVISWHYFFTRVDSIDILIYRYLGDTEGAVKSLTKAMDVLRITHGTNTPFMKDLLLKLEEARAEASYQQSSKDE